MPFLPDALRMPWNRVPPKAGVGSSMLFPKSDKAWYTRDSAGTDLLVGGDDTGWVTITFSNGWTNIGAPFQNARYCRLNGVVYIEGTIVPGTNGAAAFTLPAGFRPAATLLLQGNSNSTSLLAGRWDIASTGTVTPQAAVTWLDITTSFRASA